MKIGNLQSTKMADQGDFYLIVSHRFGPLKDGFDTFLGLDEASTKFNCYTRSGKVFNLVLVENPTTEP